jgi:hypothetical protein
MLPYWVLFAVFASGDLLASRSRGTKGSLMFGFALVFAALLIGLRYHVGGDWYHYELLYRHIALLDIVEAVQVQNSDAGYSVLNWIGQALGFRIWFVNLACGSILVWGLGKLALQQPRPWLVMLTATSYGLVVVGMGYTRQSVAIGFIAAAMASYRDRGMRGAMLYMIPAAFFHKTSILLVPLFGLSDGRRPIISAAYATMFAALLFYFLLSGSSDRLVENYVGAQMQSQGAGVRVGMTLVPAVTLLLLKGRFGLQERELSLWRTLALAGLAGGGVLAFLPSSTVVDRLNLYLIPFQCVVLSRVPVMEADERGGLALRVLIIVYAAAALFVWLNYGANAGSWIPYRLFPLGAQMT